MRLVILGTGVVGQSIAESHLRHDDAVFLLDRSRNALDLAVQVLTAGSDRVWEPWQPVDQQPLVGAIVRRGGTSDSHASGRWLINESVPERLEAKHQAVAAMQLAFGPGAIYTTNTSTLSIQQIAAAAPEPGSVMGMHFFMPVPDRPAVELIRHAATADDVMSAVRDEIRRWGRTPLIVADAPGFVVNRLLAAYLNTSLWLACGGVSAADLNHAAQRIGMPLSPLELIDQIGPETALQGGRVVWSRWPGRMDPSPLLAGVVKRCRRVGPMRLLISDEQFSVEAKALIERYQHREFRPPSVSQVGDLLTAVLAGRCRSHLE